jgi:hypothetical protein
MLKPSIKKPVQAAIAPARSDAGDSVAAAISGFAHEPRARIARRWTLASLLPIGNNGWLISTAYPHYKPSFDLNREVVQKAERYGFEFALSMIKLRGFGGKSESGTTTSNRSH